MADKSEKEIYPDLYQDPTPITDPGEKAKVLGANERHERLYHSVRYVVNNELGLLKNDLPEKVSDYPHQTMDLVKKAQFGAVYGILLADNFEDPSLGKTKKSGDDVVTSYTSVVTHKPVTVVITRRFANAVVQAVQEHTSRAELHNQVFGFMLNQAPPPQSDHHKRPPHGGGTSSERV